MGWGAGCEGCPSGIFSGFFADCGPNREKASSSIACIRLRVSFMSISDSSSLDGFEAESTEFPRFLSRSCNNKLQVSP